jgi:hypothetical protein
MMKRVYFILLLILTVSACKKAEEGTTSLQLYIPNAFYPGSEVPCSSGDIDCNRVFKVVISNATLPLLKSFELRVYANNTELFYTTDHTEGWNGLNKKEQPMNQGVYTYLLKCTDINDHTLYKEGRVMLMR